MTETLEDTKQALKLARLRREQAEAQKLEHEAELARLAAAAQQREDDDHAYSHEYERAGDPYHHIYRFFGGVTASNVQNCMSILGRWSRLQPGCDLEIVFNSPGGSVIDGMALWDYLEHLKSRGHKLTTVCRGMAASMAGILMQAGDVRVMGRESYLMIHEISAGAGGKIGEIADAVKFYERICERVVDLFVARSGGKITRAQFKKNWNRADWWIDSGEALRWGFIDEVR